MAINNFFEKQTRDELQRVLDCSGDPIIIYDKKGVVCYVNSAFEKVFGWQADQLIDNRIDFVPEKNKEQTRQAVKTVLSGQTISGMETCRKTRDGKQIHVRLSANALLDDHDEFQGMVVNLQDITELVMSRQKAQEADRAKHDFLSNISHEIRTPMNGLLGMLELLENTALNDEQSEFVSILKSSSTALMLVISDLLDFSRIEFGEIESSTIDFDLRATLEEVQNTISDRMAQKGLQMSLILVEGVPSLIRGDPERLRQILLYLLDNAVKFTRQGQVRVSIECASQTQTRAWLNFEVADSGVGIAPDKLENIFDSFSQADATATRKYGGMGIGLSITKKLIDLLGGTIEVKSSPGKGTQVQFKLEFEKQALESFVPFEVSQSIKDKKILIVDEDAANRTILKEMLKLWGTRFDEAASGDRALEKINPLVKNSKSFDVILIAMQMTGMSGERLAQEIRKIPQLLDTCLIMLSAQGKRGDLTRLEEIGVQGYLPTPVEPSLLFECISIAVSKAGNKKRVITRHFLRESKKQRLNIVLIDPTLANKKIIQNILNQSGYPLQVAPDKDQALQMLEKKGYAIALIDSELPEPEILEPLKKLQEQKEQTRAGKLVTVVMANHAPANDVAISADDYILKPLDSNVLPRLLEKWSKVFEKAFGQNIPKSLALKNLKTQTNIFNYSAALERAMDDKAFLEMLLNEFVKMLPEKISQIKTVIEKKDWGSVSVSSHSLRGSASNIGADQLCSAALALENYSDLGDAATIQESFETLEDECEQFKEYIHSIDWGDI